MARNGTYSRKIEEHFKQNPGKPISIKALMTAANCHGSSVVSAISYLNKKVREGKGDVVIQTIEPGKLWGYYPDEQPERAVTPEQFTSGVQRMVVKLAEAEKAAVEKSKISDPAPDWAEVEQQFNRQKELQLVSFECLGETTDGHPIVRNEQGQVCKVVPL